MADYDYDVGWLFVPILPKIHLYRKYWRSPCTFGRRKVKSARENQAQRFI